MEIKKLLKELCESDGMGGLDGTLKTAEKYLSGFAEVRRSGGSLIGTINGDGQKTVLLDAHIDEIGMMVTGIDNGFLKVAAAGGIDHRILAAMRVRIHGKKTVAGVFCSVPPHLKKKDSAPPDFDSLYIDTGLGESASDVISVGDRVTFDQTFEELAGDAVTGKSLDNRAGVAALIRCAELLKDKALSCRVVILLSDMEELGGDGAKTEAFSLYPDEAVVVDVSFGNAPDIPPDKTGVLSDGPMIGVSPALSARVTDRLKNAAGALKMKYQTEVIGGKTSTNADVVAVTGSGIPCGLVSIPLRNMHTPAEIVCVGDIENTAELLAEYIAGCGGKGDKIC